MAESGKAMCSKEDAEISSLKETLCAQQKLLQKLYNELEVEREAAATAASEALSMILKLQGEKAAMKMEAEQYKRLAEEKMCHAEESLTLFEEIICQTEMEVASLDYQVQAYKYKLLSMGCDDVGDIRFTDSFAQRNEELDGETSAQGLGRRNSAPPLSLLLAYQRRGATCPSSPDGDLMSMILERRGEGDDASDTFLDLERKTDYSSAADINSYFEEIRKLDGRVREIAVGVDYVNLRSGTSSPPLPQLNAGLDAMRITTMKGKDQVEHLGDSFKDETYSDSASSSGILDVFEVPQADQNQENSDLHPKDEGKKILPPDDDDPEAVQTLEKFALQPQDEGKNIKRPDFKSEVKTEAQWLKKLLTSSRDKNSRRPIENGGGHRCSAAAHCAAGVVESHSKFNHLNRTSEIVELGTQASREESSNRGEELSLLNKIKEQLNAIQFEIRSLKPTKSSPIDNNMANVVALMEVSLMEVMLGFWI